MDMQENEPESPPYQMDVYLPDFMEIDTERLARFINESDPGESPCIVSKLGSEHMDDTRIDAYTATLEEFMMAILVHDEPSPAAEIIEHSQLPEPIREALTRHGAYVLLTNTGGENYAPFENMIFLHKVAMGLCEQGALGAGNPHTGMVFPADLLLGLLEAGKDAPVEEPSTLWKSIRELHEPRELMADFIGIEAEGRTFLATRGFASCGFPDLICEVDPEETLDETVEVFESLFDYFMANGPVIQPGQTIGYDDNIAYRFFEPPEGLEIPYQTADVLLLAREDA